MINDKIPIGTYRTFRNRGEDYFDCAIIKLKDGVNIKEGDIITLDMVEPYESDAVRKVADYLIHYCSPEFVENNDWAISDAREIVKLVHEAEDADE